MTPQEMEQSKRALDDAVSQVQNNLRVEASQMLAAHAADAAGMAAAMVRSAIQTGHEMGAAHANELAKRLDVGLKAAEAKMEELKCVSATQDAVVIENKRLLVQLQAAEAKIEELTADNVSP